jgi:nitrate reductase assembly molybdenum cofactor insertion protein NarJ
MRDALYQYIHSKYQLKREEIPDHLETFHQALQNLDAGAKIMEKLIAKNLYTRLGLNFTERADWTLINYVNNVAQGTHRSLSES